MPMLEARIAGLYVVGASGTEASLVDRLRVDCEGVIGDRHRGFTRTAGGREPRYMRGDTIRNDRQWSGLDKKDAHSMIARMAELASVSALGDVDPLVFAAWLGANILFEGLPNLSQLPAGTRLYVPAHDNDPQAAILVAEGENIPCVKPGRVIASKYPADAINPSLFPAAALPENGQTNLRGAVGVIQHAGTLVCGDILQVELPTLRYYSLPQQP